MLASSGAVHGEGLQVLTLDATDEAYVVDAGLGASLYAVASIQNVKNRCSKQKVRLRMQAAFPALLIDTHHLEV